MSVWCKLLRMIISRWYWLCAVWRVCRQHGGLTELNSRLVESLQLYHSLMQELPSYSQPAVHNMPTYMSLSQVAFAYTFIKRKLIICKNGKHSTSVLLFFCYISYSRSRVVDDHFGRIQRALMGKEVKCRAVVLVGIPILSSFPPFPWPEKLTLLSSPDLASVRGVGCVGWVRLWHGLCLDITFRHCGLVSWGVTWNKAQLGYVGFFSQFGSYLGEISLHLLKIWFCFFVTSVAKWLAGNILLLFWSHSQRSLLRQLYVLRLELARNRNKPQLHVIKCCRLDRSCI